MAKQGREYGGALDQLLELTMLLSADMERGLGELGLTGPRTHLLWVVHHQGPSTQRVLADALGVSARNITGLVDALVDTGFVTREPHPTDRRATLVSLTKHGATVMTQMAADHAELAEGLFGGLGPRQFGAFVTTMTTVLDELRRRVEEAR
ncbi:MarR family winged helix-turn-helix transcriptional regulator [Nocardioides speluncae]|uniref:MarR family winged helix-turn-helix transcriptional regulator n=1 Tax=Nocardioides speluncae TaxID=2670337 RepID=UPI000D697683|nr:MarR family transcriptional regulator [Nocardioides speluncae]